jgi:putative membrane protein
MYAGLTALILHAAPRAPLGAWAFEFGTLIPVFLIGGAYAVGLRAFAHRRRERTRLAPVASFAAGWIALALALLSPLHEASEELFSAHMVQHELLMAVAAPLMVLGKPFAIMLWSLPSRARHAVGAIVRSSRVRTAWNVATRPGDAWLVHAAAIWVWHIPLLFQATLHSDLVHAAQHLSFFGSAVVFWWSILQSRRRAARGIAIVSLFTTAIHTAVLGALLSFAHTPWYPEYAVGAAQWGLTPLGDQQLAGLIMWIPAGAAYLVAALAVTRRWLAESEWRVSQAERAVAERA